MPSRLFPAAPLLQVRLLSARSSSSPPHASLAHYTPPVPPKHHPLRKSVIIAIIAASLALSFVAVLFFFIYWYFKLLKQRCSNKTTPEDDSSFKVCRFKYRQLKRATECFSESQKLGKGGFGVVYRGLLPNGKEVAVKRLDLSSRRQGEQEFQNELSICRELDSPYVVRLLGYCTHGRRVRLLVYECMQNRSLQEALFGRGYDASLDWNKRLKVIVDIAKALEFLHVQCNPAIIHGDIKPSNILLDSNFSAKIADFGLARFKTEDLGSVSFSRLGTVTVGGCTFGNADHIDPGTPEMSRSPTWKPSTECTYVTSAESPSVNLKLLANELMDSSAGDLGGTNSTPPSLSFPSFHAEATSPGFWEADSSQKPYSVLAADVLQYAQAHDSLKPLREKIFAERDLESAGGQSQETRRDLGGKTSIIDWLGSEHCGGNGQQSDSGILPSIEKGIELKEEKLEPRHVDPSSETTRKERRKAKSTHRKSREWWKDEYFAELSCKYRANQNARKKRLRIRSIDNWKDFLGGGELSSVSGELRRIDHMVVKCASHNQRSKELPCSTRSGDLSWCRVKDRQSLANNDTWNGESKGPFSSDSKVHHRQWSGDLSRSVELASRDVSSTTSTRGTVCYVAPEYGGNGVLSEKSDIYSFGVLMLVILSGRRPIQVTASPFREFESANLISWARGLSQSGKLLDLMDPGLGGEYNRKQATMCITVALLCLQRVPTARPDISQVVKILSGENTAPPLPLELSLSPPPRKQYKLPLRSSKNPLSSAVTP